MSLYDFWMEKEANQITGGLKGLAGDLKGVLNRLVNRKFINQSLELKPGKELAIGELLGNGVLSAAQHASGVPLPIPSLAGIYNSIKKREIKDLLEQAGMPFQQEPTSSRFANYLGGKEYWKTAPKSIAAGAGLGALGGLAGAATLGGAAVPVGYGVGAALGLLPIAFKARMKDLESRKKSFIKRHKDILEKDDRLIKNVGKGVAGGGIAGGGLLGLLGVLSKKENEEEKKYR